MGGKVGKLAILPTSIASGISEIDFTGILEGKIQDIQHKKKIPKFNKIFQEMMQEGELMQENLAIFLTDPEIKIKFLPKESEKLGFYQPYEKILHISDSGKHDEQIKEITKHEIIHAVDGIRVSEISDRKKPFLAPHHISLIEEEEEFLKLAEGAHEKLSKIADILKEDKEKEGEGGIKLQKKIKRFKKDIKQNYTPTVKLWEGAAAQITKRAYDSEIGEDSSKFIGHKIYDHSYGESVILEASNKRFRTLYTDPVGSFIVDIEKSKEFLQQAKSRINDQKDLAIYNCELFTYLYQNLPEKILKKYFPKLYEMERKQNEKFLEKIPGRSPTDLKLEVLNLKKPSTNRNEL